MGNQCTSFGQPGIRPDQRYAAMEKYRLSEEQISRVEDLFKLRAANKKYLTLKDFRNLYSESRFDHNDEDICAVFRALAEPPGEKSSPQQRSDGGRVTFDGFVRLTLLCANTPAVEDSSVRGGGKDVPDGIGKTEESNGSHGDQNGNSSHHGNKNGGCVDSTVDISPVEADRMRVLFDVMDSDSSGTISESEFHHFLLNFVDDKTTTQGIFSKVDHDKSRAIDFEEFNAFCGKHKKIMKAMCSYVFPIA